MSDLNARDTSKSLVVVGMSGGVDSSIAALLLKEQGYRVVGVTLRFWGDPDTVDSKSCCAPDALAGARMVADRLEIPHMVVDAVDAFRQQVVDYFVDEYARGRTPNPCIKCNARVRFGLLLDVACRLGSALVATGHYARLTGKTRRLSRGVDIRKDQSYVLAEVAPDLLSPVIFPLGEMTKDEVRSIAARAGLESDLSEESQEICFVPGDDYRAFLKRRLGERPGAIVDGDGRLLGTHSGTYNFTVGQRKGLGIACSEPLYVVAVDPERAKVIAGPDCASAVGVVTIGAPVVHRTRSAGQTTIQYRSMGRPLPASMTTDDTIVLHEPATGVAPGQTAVLYDGDDVVLAGTILSTRPWDDL